MDKGWICLHRQIRDCFLWDDKPYSKGQAWIDLLLMANHESKNTMFDGNMIEIKRGQRITSIRKLCDMWGWSNSKVLKFLAVLENEGMITKKSDTKKTLITIVKYDNFQDVGEKKRHRNDTETTQKHTNNNDNNNNNENNEYSPLSPQGEQMNDAYDYSKHTNLENVKHYLNTKEYKDWEYIKTTPGLWECIKDWMEFKDLLKPISKNKYKNEKSISKQLNLFVENSKKCGMSEVKRVVDISIANQYMGVIWDSAKKSHNTTNFEDIH